MFWVLTPITKIQRHTLYYKYIEEALYIYVIGDVLKYLGEKYVKIRCNMTMKNKTHNNNIIKDKKRFIKKATAVLQTKEYILFAYVFGSFTAEKSFHDIDIAVFIHDEKLKSQFALEMELEVEMEKTLCFPVDVRIINNAPVSFIYNVLKSGAVIVDNNISMRADFEGLNYKKYFDYRHLRDEYLREIINAPI